jgi:DNA-binding NtrC family response regulator
MLDLVMEGGMGGEETLERLKAIDPNVKAIASSGYSGFATLSEWAEYGFSAAISKPYKIDELRETLGKVLGEGPKN